MILTKRIGLLWFISPFHFSPEPPWFPPPWILFTVDHARFTNANMINGVLAFTTGFVSAFSSSSGVVMPAFIPLLPGLIEKMTLESSVPLVVSVAVGSHMVDVSPLSTLGALTIAALPDKSMRNFVFRNLLIWGLIMSVVAGILALLFMDILWISV